MGYWIEIRSDNSEALNLTLAEWGDFLLYEVSPDKMEPVDVGPLRLRTVDVGPTDKFLND